MPGDELPIILVTAADAAAAEALISELIGEEGEESDPRSGASAEAAGGGARVWLLNNKYYSARVLVQPAAGEPPAAGAEAQRAHAHVLLLQPHEGAAELEARAAAGRRLAAGAVRLALGAEAAAAGAARRLGYEPVALRGAPADEPAGLARAREALHAHEWPGLRLHDAGWAWQAGPGLGALGAARAAVAQAGLPRDQRLRRAEALLAAFCRALEPDER